MSQDALRTPPTATGKVVTARQVSSGWAIADRRVRLSFLLPAVAIVLFLGIFPLLVSLGLMFTDYQFAKVQRLGVAFVGFDNWVRLFKDERFWLGVRHTLVFVALALPLQYLLGLLLAVVLNQEFIKLRRFFRVAFLIPMMMAPVAVSVVVGRMMLGEAYGPLNDLLQRIGIAGPKWLSDPIMAMVSLILVDTWQWTPFVMLLLLAGLQGVPHDTIEAAAIDGASRWQTFRYITFPLLLPVTFTAVLIRGVEMFKVLDIVVVLTGGGHGDATEMITLYTYQVAINNFALGYASTIAFFILICIVIFTTVVVKVVRSRLPETT
jgi:multiple sugar transport system permease protein